MLHDGQPNPNPASSSTLAPRAPGPYASALSTTSRREVGVVGDPAARVFRGATLREALAAVKETLGADAIVLETRDVKATDRNIGHVEIVAKPYDGTPEVSPSMLAAHLPRATSIATQMAPPAAAPRLGPASSLEQGLRAFAEEGARAPLGAARTSMMSSSAPSSSASSSGSSTTTSSPAQAQPLRQAPARFLAPPTSVPPPLSDEELEAMQAQLIEAGVFPHIAQKLVERAARLPRRSPTFALACREAMREVIETALPPWEIDGRGRRVVALVGPTGVGKTTTIAKIAARAMLEAHRSVALITIDTYRIGAVDHLRRYGEIMGVPTLACQDQHTLRDALQRTANADLVLIDTAGRSPQESETFAAQIAALRGAGTGVGLEIHLAVQASTTVKGLRALRERYGQLGIQRLIATKLDESDGPGAVLNLAALLAAPLSCVTNGQRVPEDLHGFSLAAYEREVLP